MKNPSNSLLNRPSALAAEIASGLGIAFALAGCGGSPTSPTAPVATPGVALHGSVHGGQQPVSGATLQLYAANLTGGYGSASTPLLKSTVTTGGDGGFSISGQFICPSASSLVYLVGTGGNPGITTANPNIALMVTLGPCGSLSSSTPVGINELTTVAAVYALAPFMTSYSAVGTSTANLQGLTNAFATVNNLVNIANATVSGPTLPANAVLPVAEINTLGNILAACVNSMGGTANDGSACGSLFQYTTNGGSTPADTIAAALNIARYPSSNVASLLGLSPAGAPFQPALTAATDFTLSIKYKTAGLSTPSAAAVDAGGNLWVTNSANNSVTVLNPAGSPVAGSPYSGGGLSAPSGIAIDPAGNAWITSAGTSKLSVFTSAGSGLLTSVAGLASPSGIAMDDQGTLWIANTGNSTVTAVTTSGTTVSAVNSYSAGGINTPTAVAVDNH